MIQTLFDCRKGGIIRFVLVAVVLFSIPGCGSYRQSIHGCIQAARDYDYDKALTKLEKSRLSRSSKNKLLYLMEKGLLLHLKGDFKTSNQVLEKADLLTEELFTRSISSGTFSFITNDTVIAYAGEDYESVYLNYYKALNYLALNEIDEAAVECRRVDEKLNFFVDTYGDKNVFREDAFLRLLTGLIYDAVGDRENAYVAYRKSYEAYGYYHKKYQVGRPGVLWYCLLRAALRTGSTEDYKRYQQEAEQSGYVLKEPIDAESLLVIIIGNGIIPGKKEAKIVQPTPHGLVKLAVPVFEARQVEFDSGEVSIDGNNWYTTEVVEDLDAIARQSLEDKKGRIMAKMVARVVAKQLAARQIEKEHGPLAGLAVQVAAFVSEKADLRSWSCLSSRILMAVIPIDAGRHKVLLRTDKKKESRDVVVKKGSVGFVFTRVF